MLYLQLQTAPEKLILIVVPMQNLPDIGQIDSKTKFSA